MDELRAVWRKKLDAPMRRLQTPTVHDYMKRKQLCNRGLENFSKNRYSNILPFDEHLVELASGTYINASWIDLRLLSGGKYIVSQAPMHPDYYGEDTVATFWEMVLETRAPLVVCLAKVGPAFGLFKYWPEAKSKIVLGTI